MLYNHSTLEKDRFKDIIKKTKQNQIALTHTTRNLIINILYL